MCSSIKSIWGDILIFNSLFVLLFNFKLFQILFIYTLNTFIYLPQHEIKTYPDRFPWLTTLVANAGNGAKFIVFNLYEPRDPGSSC